MSTFVIVLLTLIGLALFGAGAVPALLVIAAIVLAVWLAFAILGLLFQIIGGVLAGTVGLIAAVLGGVMALVGVVLLPLALPLLLLVGLVVLIARAGRAPPAPGAN